MPKILNQKGVISFLTLSLLLAGIIVGTYLVQQHTNLLPKAAEKKQNTTEVKILQGSISQPEERIKFSVKAENGKGNLAVSILDRGLGVGSYDSWGVIIKSDDPKLETEPICFAAPTGPYPNSPGAYTRSESKIVINNFRKLPSQEKVQVDNFKSGIVEVYYCSGSNMFPAGVRVKFEYSDPDPRVKLKINLLKPK